MAGDGPTPAACVTQRQGPQWPRNSRSPNPITRGQSSFSARLFPPQPAARLLPELRRGATFVFGEEAGETGRVGKTGRQRDFPYADEAVDGVACGLEPEPGVNRAWRRPARHLAAHAVELRRRDAEVAGVERNGFVRPVSEGVCPRALPEPAVDLPAPPDAAAAGDQGLEAVPRVAGELAEFEHAIGLNIRQRLSPGE